MKGRYLNENQASVMCNTILSKNEQEQLKQSDNLLHPVTYFSSQNNELADLSLIWTSSTRD